MRKLNVGDKLKQVKNGNNYNTKGMIITISGFIGSNSYLVEEPDMGSFTHNYLEANFELLELPIINEKANPRTYIFGVAHDEENIASSKFDIEVMIRANSQQEALAKIKKVIDF